MLYICHITVFLLIQETKKQFSVIHLTVSQVDLNDCDYPRYAFITKSLIRYRGGDSSVGIATRHGLDDPGIESRWGARFYAPLQTGPGAQLASYTMGTGLSPGVKRPGRRVSHPPLSSAEVIERVELKSRTRTRLTHTLSCGLYVTDTEWYAYFYSPSGTSWSVLG